MIQGRFSEFKTYFWCIGNLLNKLPVGEIKCFAKSFILMLKILHLFRYDISYVPLSLHQLQLMLDTSRLSTSVPIDITQLNNTGILEIDARMEHGGIMLEEEVGRWIILLQYGYLILNF